MSNDVAHTKWWQIFEVVSGIPFLAALALSWVAPLPLPHGFLAPVLVPAGVMLIIAGGSFVVCAGRELARYGQPTDPGHPTGKIISTGVFSVSRNPLYLGGTFVLAGIPFACHLPWVFMSSHPVYCCLPVSACRTGGTVSCCQVRGAIPAVHRERPPLDWSSAQLVLRVTLRERGGSEGTTWGLDRAYNALFSPLYSAVLSLFLRLHTGLHSD